MATKGMRPRRDHGAAALPWARSQLAGGSARLTPQQILEACGRIFTRFDQQDSGNISFGVKIAGQRYFVKTAGAPASVGLPLSHAERVALLANAERLARSVHHPALAEFMGSCESTRGPMLFYMFARGEHLHEPRERREDPASAGQRFLCLPFEERHAVAVTLLELHVALADRGWVAGDFYDGCLIYDFAAKRLTVFDLDHYHQGPYENTMGRMFGSTRFMAPEEFEKGRTIDERTTVFNLGRVISMYLGERAAPVARRACAQQPRQRHASVGELVADFGAKVPG